MSATQTTTAMSNERMMMKPTLSAVGSISAWVGPALTGAGEVLVVVVGGSGICLRRRGKKEWEMSGWAGNTISAACRVVRGAVGGWEGAYAAEMQREGALLVKERLIYIKTRVTTPPGLYHAGYIFSQEGG